MGRDKKMTYSGWVVRETQMELLGYSLMIILIVLYFGLRAIYLTIQTRLLEYSDNTYITVGIPTAIIVWIVVGSLWGIYALYKDGKPRS